VTGVKGRNLILLHPANDARTELKGCIAPVIKLDGPGRGSFSRKAFELVRKTVFRGIENEIVYLIIERKAVE